MAYVPNATTVTEPVESRSVESAALEFRTLKEKGVENSNAILTALRDSSTAIGVLPSAALRAGKALVFDGAGNPTAAAIGDAADPGLRSDLAASSGAALVGYNGGTIKTALDSTIRLTGDQSIAGVKTFNAGIALGVDLPISDGGTGASTAAAAFDNLKQPSTETYTGVVELATGVEAAAGTDTARVLTPAGLRSGLNSTGSAPIYAARAWVNFNGSGTVAIRASGNVSSITDNAVGDYTVNFTSAMPDTNYAILGTCDVAVWDSQGTVVQMNQHTGGPTHTTLSVRVSTISTQTKSPSDRAYVSISIFR